MTTYKNDGTDSTAPAATPFHYEIQEIGSVLNIRMRGELDLAVAEECRLGLEEPLREPGRVVVLDVGGVSFVDSTGLALLLRTKQSIDTGGGRLLISRLSRPVLRVLEASGTLSLFEYLDGEFIQATCPVCDAKIADDAAACPSCGAV